MSPIMSSSDFLNNKFNKFVVRTINSLIVESTALPNIELVSQSHTKFSHDIGIILGVNRIVPTNYIHILIYLMYLLSKFWPRIKTTHLSLS